MGRESAEAGAPRPPSSRALVTDAHLRSSLAGIRGLGGSGVEVIGVGPRRSASALWSRHTRTRVVAPDVLDDASGFVSAVTAAAQRSAPCVVYPGREETIDALLATRLPEGVVWPFGDSRSLALRDKRFLSQAAGPAGFAPQSDERLTTAGELRRVKPELPLVVKAPLPGTSPRAAAVVTSYEELERLLAPLPAEQLLLLQAPVPGAQVVLALVLRRDGSLAARFQQHTLSTWPAAGGTTRRARSMAPDPALVDPAVRLLRAVGFWGLAQFDLILSDAGPVVLDVNPRFYDSLPLATGCGVNLPAAWHAAVLDGPSDGPATYRTGVEFRWLEADLLGAIRRQPGGSERPRERSVGALWDLADPVAAALGAADAGVTRLSHRLPDRLRTR